MPFKLNNQLITDWVTVNGIQRPLNYWTKLNCAAEGVVWENLPIPPVPTLAEVRAGIRNSIVFQTRMRLDTFASVVDANSSIPRASLDRTALITAQNATWAKLKALMEEVKAGTRPFPSGYSDIEPLLPALVWV